eukprot:jgi/Hompol1/3933/HPOL_003378-RA
MQFDPVLMRDLFDYWMAKESGLVVDPIHAIVTGAEDPTSGRLSFSSAVVVSRNLPTADYRILGMRLICACTLGEFDAAVSSHGSRSSYCELAAITLAAEFNHLAIVQRFCEISTGVAVGCFSAALRGGNLDIVQYLTARFPNLARFFSLYDAFRYNRIEIIKWLLAAPEFHNSLSVQDVKRICIETFNLEMLQYTFENNIGSPIDPLDLIKPSIAGRVDILECVHAHTPVDSMWPPDVMDKAAATGTTKSVRWIHMNRRGECSQRTLQRAITNGHLEIVKMIHEEFGHQFTRDAITPCIYRGHTEVVKYLLQHGCPCLYSHNPEAFHHAASQGHLEIIQILHESDPDADWSQLCAAAVRNGHTAVASWIEMRR